MILNTKQSVKGAHRMLGYVEGTPTTNSQLGTLEMSNFAMDVQCTGSETSVLECPHFTVENCGTGVENPETGKIVNFILA